MDKITQKSWKVLSFNKKLQKRLGDFFDFTISINFIALCTQCKKHYLDYF